ncbi:MAG: hydantoinase/oxoprolinase family protein, partial [Acetobacteraceae bacterium]
LSLDTMEAAAGIARVVDNNMATAARVHIAEAGTDPQRYRMVAFGGAGPVHAYELARLLDSREVMFPRGAGVASAIGMLVAPRAVEFTRSLIAGLEQLDWSLVRTILADLAAQGSAVLREGGVTDSEIGLETSADMRYAGQGFEVTVPLDAAALATADAASLHRAFDARYRERYGRSLGGMAVELVSWRVRAVAPPSVSEIRLADQSADGDALIERRAAWFAEIGGFAETPVYARARLVEGVRIDGPALIEEVESTVVIGPAAHVRVDHFGNLIMRFHERTGQ